MNDASFCTDAHRQAFGEEQQLAMQRLTDTTPAMQRTQRMPAATMPAPPISPYGPTMAVKGERCQDNPKPVPGARMEIAAVPLSGGAVVLFRDRDHSFQLEFPRATRQFRIPAQPKEAPLPKATVLGQASSLRVALPRAVSSQNRRLRSLGPAVQLQRVTPPGPSGMVAATPAKSGTALPVDVSMLQVNRSVERRPRQLRPATQPNRITLGASGAVCGRATRAKHQQEHPYGEPAAQVCYPLAPKLAVTLAAAIPKDFVDEKIWAALEAHPLGALLAATQYATVRPVSAQPASGSGRALLQTVEFPLLRATAEVGSGLAPVALAPSVALQPVERPAPPDAARGQKRIAKLLSTHPVRIVPACPEWLAARRLTAESSVLPVAPPRFAAGRIAANWDNNWAGTNPHPAPPARPARPAGTGLPSAAVVAIAAPSLAGTVTVPGGSNRTSIPVPIQESRPSTSLRALGDGLLLAGAVPCELRPDLAAGERPLYRPVSLQTVLRLRLPRHTVKRVSRYGTAECVRLVAPAAVSLKWSQPLTDHLILAPAAALPGPAAPVRALSLQRLPVRLYKVPGAQPMARPFGRKPLHFANGEWGGKPAVRPSGLVADDGTRRNAPKSTQQFSRELYERFTSGGAQELWRKASLLPSDLKWITMVVPLIIGIWVLARPSTAEPVAPQPVSQREEIPEIEPEKPGKRVELASVRPVTAPARETAPPVAPVKPRSEKPPVAGEPTAWDAFTARIASRASVNFNEDFRNGLSSWDGRGEWARSWSYDRAGTVRPGQMAIYQPSVGLKDYVFEMKASVERHSIQWMVRAANMQNYHFARLNVTPGAPLTRLELERWTVINGRVGKVTRLPLPHGGANQTLYAIRVEVRGDSITTYLQDQVIDTFNDARLQDGGVGLVGGSDDRPRIYGIRVTHQNDFFGKLCSFLAPQPIHTQGSD